jgi:hypothetical protein
MTSRYHPKRILGTIVTAAASALVVSYGLDWLTAWAGHPTQTFCTVLIPVLMATYMVGVIFTCTGILMWAVSWFKNDAGLGIAAGGVMLFVVPKVLPHYLGAAACVFVP